MALTVYLDQYDFPAFDYGRNITFRIYDEKNTAFDASTYTAKVKFLNDSFVQVLNDIAPSWTSQSTGTFAFTNTNYPSIEGYHYIEIQLEKSGSIVSAKSKRVYVSKSPS